MEKAQSRKRLKGQGSKGPGGLRAGNGGKRGVIGTIIDCRLSTQQNGKGMKDKRNLRVIGRQAEGLEQ